MEGLMQCLSPVIMYKSPLLSVSLKYTWVAKIIVEGWDVIIPPLLHH